MPVLVLGVSGVADPVKLRSILYDEIKPAMEASLEDGMESFDQCLFRMVKEGLIEQEEALRAADSRDGLALKFRLSEGSKGEHDPYADYDTGSASPRITHGFG